MEKTTNLPSTALNQGRRGNISIGNIAYDNTMERDMEELILDTRVDQNGNVNDEDIKALTRHGEKMVRMSRKKSEAQYERYQNLWHDFVRQKNIKEEFDNVGLTAFFQDDQAQVCGKHPLGDL